MFYAKMIAVMATFMGLASFTPIGIMGSLIVLGILVWAFANMGLLIGCACWGSYWFYDDWDEEDKAKIFLGSVVGYFVSAGSLLFPAGPLFDDLRAIGAVLVVVFAAVFALNLFLVTCESIFDEIKQARYLSRCWASI